MKDRLVGHGRKSSLWPAYRPQLISLPDKIKMRAEHSFPGTRGFSNPATEVMELLCKQEAKLEALLCSIRALSSSKPDFYSLLSQLPHCDLRLLIPFCLSEPQVPYLKDEIGRVAGGGEAVAKNRI